MIFNPLFNLVKKNPEGVKFFLNNYFYQNNYQISDEDSTKISEALEKFSNRENNDVDNFIEMFKCKGTLHQTLVLLKSENKYGFFTNGKRVYMSTLDGPSLALTICYLNTFGYENVKN